MSFTREPKPESLDVVEENQRTLFMAKFRRMCFYRNDLLFTIIIKLLCKLLLFLRKKNSSTTGPYRRKFRHSDFLLIGRWGWGDADENILNLPI